MERNPVIVVIDDEQQALSCLVNDLKSIFSEGEIHPFLCCESFRNNFPPSQLELLQLLVVDGVLPGGVVP